MTKHSGRNTARPIPTSLAGVAVVLTLGLALGACGSSDDDSPSSPGSSTSPSNNAAPAAGLDEAKKVVAAATTPPTAIPVSTPHEKPIPKGLSVTYINCGVPTCTYISNILKEGTSVLGWKYKAITTNGAPESTKAALQTVIRQKPTAVLLAGVDRAQFVQEFKQLKAQGIGAFGCCTVDSPQEGDGVILNVQGPEASLESGKVLAAWTAMDSGGKANAVYVNLPDFKINEPLRTEFKAKLKEYAPSSRLAQIDVALSDIGPAIANKTVSYVRTHPGVKYVVLTLDVIAPGLPAALKAAGLNDVKIVSQGGGPDIRQQVASGGLAADAESPQNANYWTLLDAIARWHNGESVKPDKVGSKFFLLTKDTVNGLSPAIQPDFKEQFTKLWGR